LVPAKENWFCSVADGNLAAIGLRSGKSIHVANDAVKPVRAGDDRHVSRIEQPGSALAVRRARVHVPADIEPKLARGLDESAVARLRAALRETVP